jgi:hypothetical protein
MMLKGSNITKEIIVNADSDQAITFGREISVNLTYLDNT